MLNKWNRKDGSDMKDLKGNNMKKLLLGMLLGFLLQTGLRSYYSYLWWTAQAKLTNEQMNESFHKYKTYKIVNDTIGIQDNFKYILISPVYTFRRWQTEYP